MPEEFYAGLLAELDEKIKELAAALMRANCLRAEILREKERTVTSRRPFIHQ